MELKVVCNLSPIMCVWVQLFYSPRNPLIPRHGFLLPLIYPFLWIKVTSSTHAQSHAQSRGTRTLVQRDTSDRNTYGLSAVTALRRSCVASASIRCLYAVRSVSVIYMSRSNKVG